MSPPETEITALSPELKDIRIHDLRHTFATERVGLMGIEELRALMASKQLKAYSLISPKLMHLHSVKQVLSL